MKDIIKIKENKSWKANTIPRFSLTIKEAASEEETRNIHYNVLSKLTENSDVIVELIGSFMDLPLNKRDSCTLKFLEDIRKLGVEYRCQTIASTSSPMRIFGLPGSKQIQDQEVIAHIPNELWSKTEMKKILPFHGAKYSILKEKIDKAEVLDRLQKMLDIEKADFFKLIAFDSMSLNGIGLFTSHHSLSEIKAILEIF